MDLFLVKPNLGNPLILQPKDIAEGFELTFVGKTDQCPSAWQTLLELRNGILKLKKIDGSADFGLTIIGEPYGKKVYPKPTVDFPVTSQDHQYKTGFRWEYTVKVKSDDIRRHQKWPQMFNLYYYAKRTKSRKTNYHAVYVDTKLPNSDNLTLIHVTDLHVARRNDRIPEILSEVRSKSEQRKLTAKYNNFNNNLRAVIKYANDKIKRGERVILIATGDLIDYYHDGFFTWKKGKAKMSTSNVKKLVDILIGEDKMGEPLQCPIYTILGNHDYLLNEPPLRIDIKLLKLIKVHDRDSNKVFGLSDNEGREYDYWMRGCPGFPGGEISKLINSGITNYPGFSNKILSIPKELWLSTPTIEKRKYIKKHGGWDFDLDTDQSYSLGKPEHKHLECYMEMINYETDYMVSIGSHQFACLNTGQDIYPSKNEFFQDAVWGGLSDSKKDYIEDGPHNRGIQNEHLSMLRKALKTRQPNGLLFMFTHAPLMNLPKDRMEGIDILFEDNHRKAGGPPNDITVWLGKYMSLSWMNQFWALELNEEFANKLGGSYVEGPFTNLFPNKPKEPCLQLNAIESNNWCKEQVYYFFQRKGYPQGNTNYFKEGMRDNFLNFGCADGKVDEFFKLIARSGNVLKQLNVLFSGHTHAVHEFRVQKFAGVDRFTFYIDDYSGSRKTTPQSLPSRINAQNRKIWLNNHQPLLVTSGALKRKDPEFREVVIRGNNIQSMKMKHLPRFGDENNGMEYFYTAMSVELEKFQGRSITSNRVYQYIIGEKKRNSRDHAMLRLMDKCHQLLIRYAYLPALRTGLAQEYTNITLWLNSFGVDFGGGPINSMVPDVHRNWAMTANLKNIYEGIDERIIDIFDFMKHEAGGNHLLCSWFTHESLYLAKLGGYENPYRNSLDPSIHMRWAQSVNFAVVIEDIKEKFRLQFDRLYNKRDKSKFLDFCAESSVRFASWGVEFTSRYKPSMNPDNYRNQYAALLSGRHKDVEGIWKQLSHHIGRLTSALLISGSGY